MLLFGAWKSWTDISVSIGKKQVLLALLYVIFQCYLLYQSWITLSHPDSGRFLLFESFTWNFFFVRSQKFVIPMEKFAILHEFTVHTTSFKGETAPSASKVKRCLSCRDSPTAGIRTNIWICYPISTSCKWHIIYRTNSKTLVPIIIKGHRKCVKFDIYLLQWGFYRQRHGLSHMTGILYRKIDCNFKKRTSILSHRSGHTGKGTVAAGVAGMK